MEDLSINDRIIEACRRMLGKQDQSQARQANNQVTSECVLLCNRVGPNLFDIKRGIARFAGAENDNSDSQTVLSHDAKTIFIIE